MGVEPPGGKGSVPGASPLGSASDAALRWSHAAGAQGTTVSGRERLRWAARGLSRNPLSRWAKGERSTLRGERMWSMGQA